MRILIADDDPVSRGILERLLHQWGHETIAVGD
jgi:CheY-like chemotaxis protein